MATSVFDKVNLTPENMKKSVRWYQDQVKKLGNVSRSNLMGDASKLTSTLLPGGLYMFFYDPKHKETLPYYDRFPLVLPFSRVEKGFLGLNLHYLPYMARFKLLGSLTNLTSDKKITENTRLRLSWSLLQSSANHTLLKPCVKHYLYEQLESKFLMIPYTDWLLASQLPVEKFENATKDKVWQDSRKMQ